MTIIRKVRLNKKEIALLKASLLLRGETYRSWAKKCIGRDGVKTTAPITNIITNGIVTKKIYDRFIKPLDLPFFKDFKWEVEVRTIRGDLDM